MFLVSEIVSSAKMWGLLFFDSLMNYPPVVVMVSVAVCVVIAILFKGQRKLRTGISTTREEGAIQENDQKECNKSKYNEQMELFALQIVSFCFLLHP